MRQQVLVTGGAGYIGTHTCIELLANDYDIVVVDNFSNSKPAALSRVQKIAGRDFVWYEADLRDRIAIERIFAKHKFCGVLHCAGLKSIDRAERDPLRCYENNLEASISLIETMQRHDVKRMVFSSSATVYGESARVPYREESPLAPNTVYGRSKMMVETLLHDLVHADESWNIAILRYFNPVGAHSSGLIGEDPDGVPGNLMPYICQVAVGKLNHLSIFGHDYPTPDGTGVRDYVHVMDLAQGHFKALRQLSESPGLLTVNLGAGRGYSVLEVVRAFEAASGRKVPYRFAPRRPGDIGSYYADVTRATEVLNWRAQRGLLEMCVDSWRWQSQNPDGYV
ncbi:UDP-glucose 4-epimerase GalE [Parachitinimonas caeni]|uniref:UDP-glucose 4-epimerase n=1 Tax=Parachitinimonas caeni TaxID=3031301 RepID=A0ABT7E1X1_9NEIS|nr:UDP-glucose 4-epimerase GalE [Parachitinimonas caeni]MDK2126306.1 UDP-glucose 4-epimerase GalE [Parachitinimonas caeni]